MNKEERRRITIEKYGKVVRYWSKEEIELLKKLFPDNVTEELCDIFKRSKTSIYNKAKRLGFEKSNDFLLKYCKYNLEKQRQVIEQKLKAENHWNYGNQRPEETIDKIKKAHFDLPLKHQRLYALTGKGAGEKEVKEALQRAGIEYRYQADLLGKYLVDFYLPKYKLVIEVDGPEHQYKSKKLNDIKRDFDLNNAGIKVLRIDKKEAIEHPEKVIGILRGIYGKVLAL